MKNRLWIGKLLLIVCALAAILFCVSASAEGPSVVLSGSCGDGVSFTLYSDQKLTIEGDGYMDSYTPDEPAPWFEERLSIASVEIRSGVKSVGNYAFLDCTNLECAVIPDSMDTISNFTFSGCTALTSVTIPDSVTFIYSSAFIDCSYLTITCGCKSYARMYAEDKGIRTSLTHNYVEGRCTECKEIEIVASGDCGDNVTWKLDVNGRLTISGTGAMAVYSGKKDVPWYGYRESVRSAEIKSGVTSISNCAFYECTNLKSVSIANSVVSIGDDAFAYAVALTGIQIPGNVESIGEFAFSYCLGLTEVTLPGRLTAIKDALFFECDQLEKVTIPSGVKSIGQYAFANCKELADVNIPDGMESIGDNAFQGCSSLTELLIPNSVTEIRPRVFADTSVTITCGCTSFARTYAEDGTNNIPVLLIHNFEDGFCTLCGEPGNCVAQGRCGDKGSNIRWYRTDDGKLYLIGSGAMRDYYGGEDLPPWRTNEGFGSPVKTVIIKSGITRIGNYAFYECGDLSSVSIPDTVVSVGAYAFGYDNSLKSIEIPGSVTSFGTYALAYCSGLTEVTLPGGITDVTATLFYTCRNLKKVTIPYGVSTIGDTAFFNCSSLTDVYIPESVTSIAASAFGNCTSLTAIEIPDSVESIGTHAFDGCGALTIKCSCTSAARAYADGEGISTALEHDVVPHEGKAPTCEETGWADYETCTRCDYSSYEELPPTGHKETADPYIAPTRATCGKTAGSHCETCGRIIVEQALIDPLPDVPLVTLPAAVIELAEEAYLGSGVECVILPETCAKIGSRAFAECESLKLIEIPAGVTDIAADAFEGSIDVVIVTTAESPAETFAKRHNISLLIPGK